MNEITSHMELPHFRNNAVVRQTNHFRLVMGYKPGKEHAVEGQRFYIEPLTYKGQRMLNLAIPLHHEPGRIYTKRMVPTKSGAQKMRDCIRANFTEENIPSLLLGEVVIPTKTKSSMPSLERMETCIKTHPDKYTFSD